MSPGLRGEVRGRVRLTSGVSSAPLRLELWPSGRGQSNEARTELAARLQGRRDCCCSLPGPAATLGSGLRPRGGDCAISRPSKDCGTISRTITCMCDWNAKARRDNKAGRIKLRIQRLYPSLPQLLSLSPVIFIKSPEVVTVCVYSRDILCLYKHTYS